MKNDSSLTTSSQDATTHEPAGQEKKKRGFAAMDPTLVRAIAHRGGVASHRIGKAHEFTSEEARIAGKKGGCAAHPGQRARQSS